LPLIDMVAQRNRHKVTDVGNMTANPQLKTPWVDRTSYETIEEIT